MTRGVVQVFAAHAEWGFEALVWASDESVE
jgi:hypothetical protein